jgi:hypothetical protein
MSFDLAYYFRNFNPDSPHHIAAIHDLAAHIPNDQLSPKAEWVNTFNSADMELKYDSNGECCNCKCDRT